jgi:DNA polymerase-3 subunit epsilon
MSKALDIPLTSFASAAEGAKILHAITDKYELCQKLNGLYKSNTSCFRFQTKECKGACIKAETAEHYNARVNMALEKMEFAHDNFIIIDKGRTKTERSMVWVEHGSYIGFGFVPFPVWRQSSKNWSDFMELQVEDKDDRAIISLHLRKNEDAQVKVMESG